MQGFTTKLTAYDFLGMLIPGIVVVYCICQWFCPCVLVEVVSRHCCGCVVYGFESQTAVGQVCVATVILSVSYIVGLIVNCVSDLLFGRFRNNEIHLKRARLQYLNHYFGTDKGPEIRFETKYFKNLSQFFGARKKFYTITEEKYYQRYYWLLNNNKLCGAIPALEVQVTFVRNMVLPTLLLVVVFSLKSLFKLMPNLVVALLLFFIFIGELYVMYARQMRVYEIVYEDSNRYKQMSKYENRNNSINN